MNREAPFGQLVLKFEDRVALVTGAAGDLVAITGDEVGSPGRADYSLCKAGIIMLTKTLAMENAKRGVTFVGNVRDGRPFGTAETVRAAHCAAIELQDGEP